MFFRRPAVQKMTFEDHMKAARSAGFRVESAAGKTRIERKGVACVAEDGGSDLDGNTVPRFTTRAGIVVGTEIATLTDGGFQKFFITPSGRKMPALSEQLVAIQNFQEDLRETLGMISLYNEAMGTVSNKYLYDRVQGRDKGVHKPWQVEI